MQRLVLSPLTTVMLFVAATTTTTTVFSQQEDAAPTMPVYNYSREFLNPKHYAELDYSGVPVEAVEGFGCSIPVASSLVVDGVESVDSARLLAPRELLAAAREAAEAANLTYVPQMMRYSLSE